MSTAPGPLEVQGHRGARGHLPENTLAGFRLALAQGVHTLELDVGLTADGVVVVHHDPTLNPDTTRDARGEWLPPDLRTPLVRMSYDELRTLDVGGIRPDTAYARSFPDQASVPGARIPTLAEVAALVQEPAHQAIRLNVEVKVEPEQPALTAPPDVLADAVLEVLDEQGIAGRSAVQSFDWRVVRRVREQSRVLRTGLLSAQRPHENTVACHDGAASPWTAGLRLDDFDGSVADMAHAAGCDAWVPHHLDLDETSAARARDLGMRIGVWTVNEPEDIDRALRLGVDSIISDYPDRVFSAASTR